MRACLIAACASVAALCACGEKPPAPASPPAVVREEDAPRPIDEILQQTLTTFDAFDADKNGEVTAAERQAAVERREARTGVAGRAGMDPEDLGAADADKDGAVTRAEVETLVRTRLDADKDGLVTADELWNGFRAGRKAAP